MSRLAVGRILNAIGVALATFLTSLLVYKGFSELTADALYQPLLQSILTGLSAFGIGPAAGYLTSRKPPAGPTGQGGRASLGLLVILAALALLAGCASLGFQRSTVSFPRDELLLTYADARQDYGEAKALVEPGCIAKALPEATCAKLGQLRDRFVAADKLFRAAVLAKRNVGLEDLRGLLGVAAEIARLAGYPVPNLGGLGKP